MKQKVLLLVVVLCIVMCGCDTTSKQRIEGLQQALGIAQSESKRIDSNITLLQTTIADL